MFPIQEIPEHMPFNVGHLMPKWEEIPDEFKRFSGTKWNRLMCDWFFFGLKKLEVTPKTGVDKDKALWHINAVMRSCEPAHEHKEAAVAFLMSEWFEDAVWEKNDRKEK